MLADDSHEISFLISFENWERCRKIQKYVVGTQKNRLKETVLLSTQNTCIN